MDVPTKNSGDLDEFYIQALLLSKVVTRLLKKQGDIDLYKKPAIAKHPITEFAGRMRVTGVTKFEYKTYISVVNFYLTDQDKDKNKALGAIIIYICENYIVDLLKKLGYPVVDEDDEDALEDAIGTFCNLIAGNFKAGLTQLGYKELAMSHFLAYQNDILNGIAYDKTQTELYELTFTIKGEKWIVIDYTMGPIPQV